MTMVSSHGLDRSGQVPRWWRSLLVASLALNLLIAGAVLGGAWVMRHHGERPGPGNIGIAGPGVGPVGKFIGTLPPERRAELHDVIDKYQSASADFNRGMLSARHEAGAALMALPFERARFEAALKRIYEAELTGRTAMIAIAGDVVAHLDGREREKFVQLLRWQQANESKGTDGAAETKAP